MWNSTMCKSSSSSSSYFPRPLVSVYKSNKFRSLKKDHPSVQKSVYDFKDFEEHTLKILFKYCFRRNLQHLAIFAVCEQNIWTTRPPTYYCNVVSKKAIAQRLLRGFSLNFCSHRTHCLLNWKVHFLVDLLLREPNFYYVFFTIRKKGMTFH